MAAVIWDSWPVEESRTAIGVEVEVDSPEEEGTEERRRNTGVEAPGEV